MTIMKLTIYSCLFSLLAFPLMAQSRGQIIDQCLANLESGITQDTEALIAEITSWNDLSLTSSKTKAAECLSSITGEEWEYSSKYQRGFISGAALDDERAEREASRQGIIARREAAAAEEEAATEAVRLRVCELREVVTETNQTLLQAEAAKLDRRIENLAVTIQECSAWFEDDARAALTNDVCNSIFASGGLPNSEIAGPTTLEVLLAEVIHTNASTELEILVESGMLLETIKAMAAEMGIPESGDAYDCDQ